MHGICVFERCLLLPCTGKSSVVWFLPCVSWQVTGKLGHTETLPGSTSYFPYPSPPTPPFLLLRQLCYFSPCSQGLVTGLFINHRLLAHSLSISCKNGIEINGSLLVEFYHRDVLCSCTFRHFPGIHCLLVED